MSGLPSIADIEQTCRWSAPLGVDRWGDGESGYRGRAFEEKAPWPSSAPTLGASASGFSLEGFVYGHVGGRRSPGHRLPGGASLATGLLRVTDVAVRSGRAVTLADCGDPRPRACGRYSSGDEEGPECARSLGRLAFWTVEGYPPAMLSRFPPPAGFIEPCLPTLAREVPDGPLWIHEIKHDAIVSSAGVTAIACACSRATERIGRTRCRPSSRRCGPCP
jgi:hypothetical protein